MNKAEKDLQDVITQLEKIAVDVCEITNAGEAEFQAKQIEKQTKKLIRIGAGINIHGSGTGEQ